MSKSWILDRAKQYFAETLTNTTAAVEETFKEVVTDIKTQTTDVVVGAAEPQTQTVNCPNPITSLLVECADLLPWERASELFGEELQPYVGGSADAIVEVGTLLRERILALHTMQLDDFNTALDETWSAFDVLQPPCLAFCRRMIEGTEGEDLKRMRYRNVPRKMDELTFWRLYLFHVTRSVDQLRAELRRDEIELSTRRSVGTADDKETAVRNTAENGNEPPDFGDEDQELDALEAVFFGTATSADNDGI